MGGTVIIAGAGSFLGKAVLRERLLSNFEVVTLNRQKLHSLSNAIEAENFMSTLGQKENIVFLNLIGHSVSDHKHQDITPMVEAHILFPSILMELAWRSKAKFIQIRSYWEFVFGKHSKTLNLYAATRKSLTSIAHWYAIEKQLDLTNLVISDTFGPKDPRQKLLPSLINAYKTGSTLELGSRSQAVDLVCVRDAANAIVLLLGLTIAKKNKDEGNTEITTTQIFQVSSEAPIKIGDLIDRVAIATGRTAPVVWSAKKLDRAEVNSVPLVGPLVPGWAPSVNLEQIIKAVAAEIEN